MASEGGQAQYILVSLPTGSDSQQSARRTWNELTTKTSHENELSTTHHFHVPSDLRVGTLDSLLALSDELSKATLLAESTVSKISRELSALGFDVRFHKACLFFFQRSPLSHRAASSFRAGRAHCRRHPRVNLSDSLPMGRIPIPCPSALTGNCEQAHREHWQH